MPYTAPLIFSFYSSLRILLFSANLVLDSIITIINYKLKTTLRFIFSQIQFSHGNLEKTSRTEGKFNGNVLTSKRNTAITALIIV